MTPSAAPDPWRCPRCDADRSAEDAFCGRCGAARPRPGAAPDPTGPAPGSGSVAGLPIGAGARPEERTRSFPVVRALVLNGVILGAVVLAVVLAGGGSPTSVSFEPAAWRCDGMERAWVATIPPGHLDLRIDWRTGGPVGDVRATATTTRVALEPYLRGDGSFRVLTRATDAPECGLPPGTYTMTIRDDASGALIAAGDVALEP